MSPRMRRHAELLRRLVNSATGLRAFASAAPLAGETPPLKRTALYDFHVQNGAKMVPFAGWSMPLLYKDSILSSTLNCREKGSLFDVSHMCGLSLKGRDAIPFLETLVVADVAGLPDGTGTLSAFTNERGGTIDDTVVTKVNDAHIYLVVNAGCRDKDLEHIHKHLDAFTSKGGKQVVAHIHDERSLLALQGPLAAPTLQRLVKEDLTQLYFGHFKTLNVNGADCFVTRTGYTGEDGFEISVPSEQALELAKAILDRGEGKLLPTGLGARDSLRLEAGLCLYGNDMDEETSLVEAGLAWTVGKRRRAEGGFLGADVILRQLKEGVSRRRVGIISEGAPARPHSLIYDKATGEQVGEVTSGGFSPCLRKNIAMGYVASGRHKEGTQLLVSVRDKKNEAVIAKMPFVPAKYYKKPQ